MTAEALKKALTAENDAKEKCDMAKTNLDSENAKSPQDQTAIDKAQKAYDDALEIYNNKEAF